MQKDKIEGLDISQSHYEIGNVYYHQGKYDDAIFMYEKSLQIQLPILGNNHSNIAGAYNNIGLVYYHQGKFNEAISMYQKAIKIQLIRLSDNHPSIADIYNNMGLLYRLCSKQI